MTKSIKYSLVINAQYYRPLEDGSEGAVIYIPLRARTKSLDPSKFAYLDANLNIIIDELEDRSLELTSSSSAWVLKRLLDLRCEITLTLPICTIKC